MNRPSRTPWLALVDLPHTGHLERQMASLSRWLTENPDAHPERRAIVQSLHASLDRTRRELLDAHWMLEKAIQFRPMDAAPTPASEAL